MTIIEASERGQEIRKQINELISEFIKETNHIPMLESYTLRPIIQDGKFSVDFGVRMGIVGMEEAEDKVKGILWAHTVLKSDKK